MRDLYILSFIAVSQSTCCKFAREGNTLVPHVTKRPVSARKADFTLVSDPQQLAVDSLYLRQTRDEYDRAAQDLQPSALKTLEFIELLKSFAEIAVEEDEIASQIRQSGSAELDLYESTTTLSSRPSFLPKTFPLIARLARSQAEQVTLLHKFAILSKTLIPGQKDLACLITSVVGRCRHLSSKNWLGRRFMKLKLHSDSVIEEFIESLEDYDTNYGTLATEIASFIKSEESNRESYPSVSHIFSLGDLTDSRLLSLPDKQKRALFEFLITRRGALSEAKLKIVAVIPKYLHALAAVDALMSKLWVSAFDLLSEANRRLARWQSITFPTLKDTQSSLLSPGN